MWPTQQSVSNTAFTTTPNWPWLSFTVFRDGTYTLTLLNDVNQSGDSQEGLKLSQEKFTESKNRTTLCVSKSQRQPSLRSASIIRSGLRASSLRQYPLTKLSKMYDSVDINTIQNCTGESNRLATVNHLKMSSNSIDHQQRKKKKWPAKTGNPAPVFFTLNANATTNPTKISTHDHFQFVSNEKLLLTDKDIIKKEKSLIRSVKNRPRSHYQSAQNLTFTFNASIKEKPISSAATFSRNESTSAREKQNHALCRSKTEQSKLIYKDSPRPVSSNFTEIMPLKSILKNRFDMRPKLTFFGDDTLKSSFRTIYLPKSSVEHEEAIRNISNSSNLRFPAPKREVRFNVKNSDAMEWKFANDIL